MNIYNIIYKLVVGLVYCTQMFPNTKIMAFFHQRRGPNNSNHIVEMIIGRMYCWKNYNVHRRGGDDDF
jgi:hypothetical protein